MLFRTQSQSIMKTCASKRADAKLWELRSAQPGRNSWRTVACSIPTPKRGRRCLQNQGECPARDARPGSGAPAGLRSCLDELSASPYQPAPAAERSARAATGAGAFQTEWPGKYHCLSDTIEHQEPRLFLRRHALLRRDGERGINVRGGREQRRQPRGAQ